MNEPSSEKLPADKGGPKKPSVVEKYFADLHGDGKLTRVPVKHLYSPPGEYFDFQGAQSQLSNMACVRPSSDNSRYWVCDFIPAWQCFELTFVPGGGAEPLTELMPASHVKRWKR